MRLDDFNADYFDDGSMCDGEIITMARELIENQLKMTAQNMASYMVATGCSSTMSGNRIFSFNELSDMFNVSVDWIKKNEDKIIKLILSHSQVMDGDGLWVYNETDERFFDLNFYGNYCGIETDDNCC